MRRDRDGGKHEIIVKFSKQMPLTKTEKIGISQWVHVPCCSDQKYISPSTLVRIYWLFLFCCGWTLLNWLILDRRHQVKSDLYLLLGKQHAEIKSKTRHEELEWAEAMGSGCTRYVGSKFDNVNSPSPHFSHSLKQFSHLRYHFVPSCEVSSTDFHAY